MLFLDAIEPKTFSLLKRLQALPELAATRLVGGRLKELCDLALCVPAGKANHIQELHIAIGHMLCGLSERALNG